MPNDLQARLLVDTSDYKAGMADAASATQVLKTARASLAEAELAFGRAAEQGSQQAKAALQEYRDSVMQAEAAVAALGATQREGAAATRAQADATRAASQSYNAANTELRVLSGSMYGADRAAAQLLSSIPGVGRAMNAAFSGFAVAALLQILVQVGNQVQLLIGDYESLSSAARQAAIDQADAAARGSVTVQPKAGVTEKIARLAKEFTDTGDAPGAVQSAGGSNETANTAAGVEKLNAAQTELLLSQNRINDAGRKGSDLAKQKQKDIQAEIDLLYKQSNALGDVQYASQQLIKNQNSTQDQVKFAQQQITAATEGRDAINTRIQVLGNNKQAEAKEQSSDGTKEDNSAAEALMRAAETRFAELHTKLPEQAIAFWKQYVGAFQQGSAEYLRVIEQVNHYTDEFEKGLSLHSKAVESYQAEQKKLADLKPPNLTEVNKWLTEVDEDLTRTGERWRQYHTDQAKATEDAALAADALRRQSVSFELANGAITRVGAAQRLAAIDADEYRVKLEALKQILEELKREGAGLEPGNPKYAQNQSQQAQVQNQITQLQGQGALTGQKDQSNTAQAIAAPYTQGFQMVGDAWMRVQQQILTSHKSFSQAMAQQAGSMVLQMMEGVEKWALRWAEAEMRSIALHSVSNQIKVGSDQVAAAQSNAIKLEQGAKEALIDAKNAAVAGWKAGMALPFPENVVMAPALAAVGLAGALAQFEVGTNFVPKTGVAMIHEGERIVPRADNEKLMNALGAGGAGGNSFHSTINYHSHVGSASANELSTAMARRLSRMQAVMPRR